MTDDASAHLAQVLASGDLEISGRLVQASNATFLAEARDGDVTVPCVYKPIRGEKPLWDFPTGTLAGREVAAYALSELGGWGVVPTTVLGDGPFGPGMVQAWVDSPEDSELVDVVPEGEVPDGWLHVLDAFDERDRPISLVHADDPGLRRLAVFDVVVNNADRKGGHVLPHADGQVRGCDHGICFHTEDKLRTVLWGWGDSELTDDELFTLGALRIELEEEPVRRRLLGLISPIEHLALVGRVDALIGSGRLPEPGRHWPSIPWPAF
ncbi:SCO1664 family protein [Solicola sp. PLA-1-18]|uniref:SCO1664 family protein n=1 Tax=Solicola sp. PLA-1-18 TaxID=3380532 RepID=UPI003B7C332E